MPDSNSATVYLIPCPLAPEALHTLPPGILDYVRQCKVLFVENERTTRRFLKLLDREVVIDDFEWVNAREAGPNELRIFESHINQGHAVGILSEAGCPGIADPGQVLVRRAHQLNARVVPITGPSSLLLSLMSSGLNGQQFCFHGYLPVQPAPRQKALVQLEQQSLKTGATQMFIETPYRNEKMVADALKTLHPETLLCIAADLTAPTEWIKTMPVRNWRNFKLPGLSKRPAVFLIGRG